MSDALLELRDVFVVHRSDHGDAAALQGVDLELASGEMLCLLGPSGAGKTTLLRVIGGLQAPSAGRVLFSGQDIGRLQPRARAAFRQRSVGTLRQGTGTLAPDLPVARAIELPLALRGVPRRIRSARAQALLDAAGLADRASALPGELSGGERQRVALCTALVHEPALLLADEPTGELDRATATRILELIRAMARAAGTSVILASHDPGAGAYADRTLAVCDGRIVDESRDGAGGLVVSETGWVRIPEALRAQAGIRGRVVASAAAGKLILEPTRAAEPPAAGEPLAAGQPAAAAVRAALAAWNAAMVETSGLGRSYAQGGEVRVALGELTHTFAPARLTVVTGRSGSGKTTLLRLLAGLDRPDRGALAIDGRRLDGLGREQLAALRRERIGYLPQEPHLVDFLSARENALLTLQVRDRAGDPTALERASVVLGALGLADRASHRASSLSAGELQRVGLARALVAARGLLIADEPTSRLDRANAELVAACLAEAAQRERQTVICASHDPELIARADVTLSL